MDLQQLEIAIMMACNPSNITGDGTSPHLQGNASHYNVSGNHGNTSQGLDVSREQAQNAECEALMYKLNNQFPMSLSMGVSDKDQYTRDLITYYLMGIGGMTLCCLGLIGNMLSLIVLTQKNMRSSTYSYLSALAVCDSLMLLFTILLLVKDINKPEPDQQVRWPWDEGAYPYLFPYVHPLAFMFQVTSIWLTLSFTVDRYIMICHPFTAEPFCTVSRARKVIISLSIGSFFFNLPKFFEYKTITVLMLNNTTKIGCDLTNFGRSKIFRELYHSWFYIVFVCGVPFLTLAILNAFLINAVRLSRKRGREINAAERKKNDTTVMLIGVVITFFTCQMPALVSRLLWALQDSPDQSFKQLPLFTLNEIASFLIVLNSAINIVPYYFFGARFRKHFWRLFCSCLFKYKAFKKLTRSFSLTLMDDERRPSAYSCAQRLSVVSNQTNIVKGSPPKQVMVMLMVPNGNSNNWSSTGSDNCMSLTVMSDNGEKTAQPQPHGTEDKQHDPATQKLLEPSK